MNSKIPNLLKKLIPTRLLVFKSLFILVLAFSFSCQTKPCKIEERSTQSSAGESETSSQTKLTDEAQKALKGTQMSRVKIFKADGSLQCNQGKKISLDEMAKQLKDIKIYSSENKHDGLMRAQMCGRPTGFNNVYEIDVDNLDKAVKLGFNKWIRE